MKKFVALSVLFFTVARIGCMGQSGAHQLSASEKAYVLSRFCTEVKYNFASYSKLKFDWDSICAASMPMLVNTSTDEDFVKGMQALCARLQDGHTYIFTLNNPDNPDDWIRPLPMKTKRIGNSVFVTDVYSTVLQEAGVAPGCEVVKIDGEGVLEYAKNHIRPSLPSSTPQWSDYRPFAGFELTKDKGSKISEFLFRDKGGKEFVFTSNRLIPWDIDQQESTMNFKMLPDNVGLLTIRSFQNSDFNRSYFDQLYEDILKTDALIIDIRDNGGGNSGHADYLISHFSDRPIPQGKWSSPMYIAAHASWSYPQEWYMETPDSLPIVVGKEIYGKPVVMLVNATTFSSAENLCVSFRGAKRGRIIGTPTGGSTGNPIFIDLGSGIGCKICTKYELDADGNEFIGLGIQPDIVVGEDVDAYLRGEDNMLEKALDVLRAERAGENPGL